MLFHECTGRKEGQQTKIWNVHSPTGFNKKHFLYLIKANEKMWIHFQIPLLKQLFSIETAFGTGAGATTHKVYPTGFSHSQTMWEKWARVKSF